MSFSERHWDAINRREILIVDCSNPLTFGNIIHERMVRALEGKELEPKVIQVDFEDAEAKAIVLHSRLLKALDDNILTAPASRIKNGKGPRDKWGKLK